MGKNIKSYATTQVHFPGKGREASRQKSKSFGKNMVRFNRTHLFLNLQAKFFKFMFCTSIKSTANYANSKQFAPKIPHHLLIHYVSDACTGREFSQIPVNYANFVQFAHNFRKSREICTIY